MRYAIFTDVHANLEALEAVLAKIDEIAQEEPIDQIWFLGDLVGYGPNPNECIETLRARTGVIIAGNHDWAAVGKISLDDFSEAARISAEWTARQLSEEHREFLINLPEHIEREDCLLVHGSPYGPLWEYLTSEVLAERSFECFSQRYCFVGHTHIPVIFQQPYDAHEPLTDDDDDTIELVSVRPPQQSSQAHEQSQQARVEQESSQAATTDTAAPADGDAWYGQANGSSEQASGKVTAQEMASTEEGTAATSADSSDKQEAPDEERPQGAINITSEEEIQHAEECLNEEIEELLSLLGISEQMLHTTNEMVIPPEGHWQAPDNYRAIINPGGVGQPRDGDPRAALMIYDTEHGFTFYRIEYNIEKTQEKIIKAGLPPYLAARLAYGR